VAIFEQMIAAANKARVASAATAAAATAAALVDRSDIPELLNTLRNVVTKVKAQK
jgi:hypothetical protein